MVVLLLRTLMLLLKSDDDENETNADVLKRPRMCVCACCSSLSRYAWFVRQSDARKVRMEKGKSPKYKSVSRTNTNVHSQLLCRGCLSSLSLLIEKCRIETTKASQGGEQRKEYRRHHIVLLLLISHRPLRHLRDNKT